ncbi:MAG: septum formation initiator [Candidatus Wallbacteria bacterium HGW-Wallbacteria-1]|jgi:cell division initiation protein|uniref:Septum formation initiator n=1 Tax=Candidatus Wallbacteria bacterium HGW-Wallbacteria-1 TaxID=2013854 RepID=A0A2N1PV21_9BACT|nr:MAG: septum formation initiator [Candidatus Wallbacteria bacterium HGW-Wallbacteria-1]
MKITPIDIHQKVFRKSFRGYDIDEVDDFLEKVGREFEVLFTENQRLKERLERVEDQMKDYIEMEKTLKETLVAAQRSSGEMKMNAEKESELIIRESEITAEKMIESAKNEARMIMKELAKLKQQKKLIRLDIKSLLDSYYEMLGFEAASSNILQEKVRDIKKDRE